MWVFRKDILSGLGLESDVCCFSHEIKIEACHHGKYRWKEVPIRYRGRLGGVAKLTGGWQGWRAGISDFLHILKMGLAR